MGRTVEMGSGDWIQEITPKIRTNKMMLSFLAWLKTKRLKRG